MILCDGVLFRCQNRAPPHLAASQKFAPEIKPASLRQLGQRVPWAQVMGGRLWMDETNPASLVARDQQYSIEDKPILASRGTKVCAKFEKS